MPEGFQRSNIRYRHEAIADLMIENPKWSQNAIALQLGLTPPYLSRVVTSDGFKEYFALRRMKHEAVLSTHVVERDDQSLMQKAETVASKALDAIEAKLDTQGGNLELKELNDTAGKALAALGFGSAPGGDRGRGNKTQINFYTGAVSPEDLERARATMELSASTPAPADNDEKVIEHVPATPVPATG